MNGLLRTELRWHLVRAVDDGMSSAALVDRHGNVVAVSGSLNKDQVTPLTGLVMHRLKSEDLADRLFAGEIVSTTLDDREIAVGIARRQLFVVAILGATTIDDVKALRIRVSKCLPDPEPIHMAGDQIGGFGPADLPLIEYGITVRRDRGKA